LKIDEEKFFITTYIDYDLVGPKLILIFLNGFNYFSIG
jgi:hypothetical protein